MPYTYKYYPASMGTINKNPKQEYLDLFQESLRDQFYNTWDVHTIEEETSVGSGLYQNVDVRINRVIDASTGDRVGDDFRKLLFQNLEHPTELGWMYQFEDNYWVATNIDKIKSLTTSVTVRRCNNTLRWFDSDGGYYEFPCALGYLIKENRDFLTSGSNIVNPSGMIECYIQSNPVTNRIRPNQRFLFGNSSNWSAWRVEGGGINNFLNRKTSDNNSASLLILSMSVDYINDQEDDFVNGVANATSNQYSISLDESSIEGVVGNSISLQAVVYLNGNSISRTVDWSSDDESVATVDSSGTVTFVSNGSANITASLGNNSSVYDVCSVIVSATPQNVYQVIYSPNKTTVFEGENETWSFNIYKDGVIQADTFTFSLNPNSVPSTKYVFIAIDGHSFVIQNLEKHFGDYLTVTATSGVHSVSINITLSGNW